MPRSSFDYSVLDYYGNARGADQNVFPEAIGETGADYAIETDGNVISEEIEEAADEFASEELRHANFDYSLLNMHSNDYSSGAKNEDNADLDIDEELRVQAGVNLNEYADKDMDEDLKLQAGAILDDDEIEIAGDACLDEDLANNTNNRMNELTLTNQKVTFSVSVNHIYFNTISVRQGYNLL